MTVGSGLRMRREFHTHPVWDVGAEVGVHVHRLHLALRVYRSIKLQKADRRCRHSPASGSSLFRSCGTLASNPSV